MARARDIDTRPASVEKTFFDLSKGLVTEISPLGMPGGTTIAESNFEIMRDGTRRRRKGVRQETGGTLLDFAGTEERYPTTASAFASYRWAGVNSDPSLVIIVAKIGQYLRFYKEGTPLSANIYEDFVDLSEFRSITDTEDTYDYVGRETVTMSSLHGRLFVAGAHINPFYVAFDPETLTFNSTPLQIKIRDFWGIDDGVGIGVKPTTLSDDHKYNIANRGWGLTTWTKYYQGKLADGGAISPVPNKYPAKNQIWWKALVRYADGSYEESFSDLYKIKKFDTKAIEAEIFGTMSAPQGHLFLNPFDTRIGMTDGVEADGIVTKQITDVEIININNYVDNGDGTVSQLIRFRLTVPNSSDAFSTGDEVMLRGFSVNLKKAIIKPNPPFGYTYKHKEVPFDFPASSVEIVGDTTTTVDVRLPYTGPRLACNYSSGSDWYLTPENTLASVNTYGTLEEGGYYTKSSGYVTDERPRATAAFAGRAWFAGCNHPELANVIFYSQIGDSTTGGTVAYSKMYQASDPTSEYNNIVLPTDGGMLTIAGLSGVVGMVPVGTSIVILANTGIWEINGGDSYFSAVSQSQRKISEIEVVSPDAWALTDDGLVVASPRGIFRVQANDQSGRLGVESLTLDTINTYWQSIPVSRYESVRLVYDNSQYRLYTFFSDSSNLLPYHSYNRAVVYDIYKQGFYKLDFPATGLTYIHGVTTLNDVSVPTDNTKVKFFVMALDDNPSLFVCDMANTSFVDWNSTEQIPFLETGYDGVGESNYRAQEVAQAQPDHARDRFSPNIFVYMKRTETGVDSETLEVLGQSSLLMEGRWNFVDNYASGQIGSTQQVYRPRSSSITEIPAGKVVVSRNKVRGKGRSLHLKFTGEAGKDAHLLGYSIEYKAERKA